MKQHGRYGSTRDDDELSDLFGPLLLLVIIILGGSFVLGGLLAVLF